MENFVKQLIDNNIEKKRQEKLNWGNFDNSQNISIEYYQDTVTSISPTSTTLINVIQ